jgi:hypothetical protein
LGLFSRKDFFRLILIVVFFAAVILVFSAEMQSAFRINEFSELEGADSNGSINYRIQNLWPVLLTHWTLYVLCLGEACWGCLYST